MAVLSFLITLSDFVGHECDILSIMNGLNIEHLDWDDWNREHIAKHHVLPSEVEEMIATSVVVRETYKQRHQVLGPTLSGRILSVIVGLVPNHQHTYYVFSARSASRSERKIYDDLQKGGSGL